MNPDELGLEPRERWAEAWRDARRALRTAKHGPTDPLVLGYDADHLRRLAGDMLSYRELHDRHPGRWGDGDVQALLDWHRRLDCVPDTMRPLVKRTREQRLEDRRLSDAGEFGVHPRTGIPNRVIAGVFWPGHRLP